MTGRDLIIYILENGLENEPVFENGKLLGFMTVPETALKFGVGSATVSLWCQLNIIPCIEIGEIIYIPATIVKGVDIK